MSQISGGDESLKFIISQQHEKSDKTESLKNFEREEAKAMKEEAEGELKYSEQRPISFVDNVRVSIKR